MLAFIVLSVVATAPVAPKLIILDLVPGEGVDPTVAISLSSTLTVELERRAVFEVVSSRDIAAALGLERQRQLLGCGDGTSCVAELSGAFGAQLVLSGTLVRMGDAFALNLQTTDSKTMKSIGRSVRIAKQLSDLAPTLPFAVAEATGLPAPPEPSRVAPLMLIGAGAAAVVGGAVVGMQVLFKDRDVKQELQLAQTNPSVLRPASAYDADLATIATQKTIAVITLSAGAALVALGVVLYPRPGSTSFAVTLIPAPGGVGFAGVWP